MSGDTTRTQPSIQALLAEAREAGPENWIETYRDALASAGPPAITGVEGWFRSVELGPRASRVLLRAATEFGFRRQAVAALRRARLDVATPPANLPYIDDALRLAGVQPEPPRPAPGADGGRLPAGTRIAPPYAVVSHVVDDHADVPTTRWGDLYLFSCGRFFSGKWVRDHGGLLEPRGRHVCALCVNAGARAVSVEDPAGPVRGGGDASDRLYVLGPVWHMVNGAEASAPRVGRFYPFECYRWVTVHEAGLRGLWRGTPPADAPVCGTCLWYSRISETRGALDDDVADEPI